MYHYQIFYSPSELIGYLCDLSTETGTGRTIWRIFSTWKLMQL